MAELSQFTVTGAPVDFASISNETDQSSVTASNDLHGSTNASSSIGNSLNQEARAAAAAAAAAGSTVHTSEPSHDPKRIDPHHHNNPQGQDQPRRGTGNGTSSLRRPDASGEGHNRKVYDCHLCGWRFALKGNLVAHLRRHTGEKPYVCNICHRKFTQSSLLTVHMRTHTGEKPFKCDKCGRSFSRSGNLTTHMRTHNATKPFECAFCHKTFSQRVNMELHTRVHTGVKPYRCGVCNRAFTSCSNMRRHWRHIHPSYPEPAMGTLHLLHGMPEKALYFNGASRDVEYRVQHDQFGEDQSGITHLPVREEVPSMLRQNVHDQMYAQMLRHSGINGMPNQMPNQIPNPMPSQMQNPMQNPQQMSNQMPNQLRNSISDVPDGSGGLSLHQHHPQPHPPLNAQMGAHLNSHMISPHDSMGDQTAHQPPQLSNHMDQNQQEQLQPGHQQQAHQVAQPFMVDSTVNQQFNGAGIGRVVNPVPVLSLGPTDDFDPAIKEDSRVVTATGNREH